jgi:hypothetical protein
MQSQTPQEYFRTILLTVVGQAFSAAGYSLNERPVQWAGGLFRFSKPLDGATATIEFQMLGYADMPSRFQVILSRTPGRLPAVRRTLAALVYEDFGVPILPSADHWWTYVNVDQLGRALGEAGSLAVAYGMPWLSGELTPDDSH